MSEHGDHKSSDERMAKLLADGDRAMAQSRRRLQEEQSAESEDLLERINALEFVSSVVGEATDIPDRLGEYEITGLLGRGGMGTVYEAFQQSLEREVALKVLSPIYSTDPKMRQRFRSEARATAALHHQHIVPIYDYGEAAGCLYFAMEKVDGVSLDKQIAMARRRGERPMEPRDAALRFAGVASALALAHRRRILHRDVKPGNILVAPDGTLALADFGLSKVLGEGSVRLTSKGGGFLGTLHYSPPEQALGQDLTPAGDLYSLGVTLFEAVTGELPIEGKTTEAALQSIIYGAPKRLRECLPRPPRDLELVLDKLLSKEPTDRYADGGSLARDLRRIGEGEPVHIRRQPIVVRAWRRMRKNPLLYGAVVTAAVLLLVTMFLWRVLQVEQGNSLESRHRNELVRVLTLVKSETGSVQGPEWMLSTLTGESVPSGSNRRAEILSALSKSRDEMPGDSVPISMRAAYERDPLPAATELLRDGAGYQALKLYSPAIEETAARVAGIDHSVEIRLYGLYLGRAVANLTASVARLDDARLDLALASFLRPGAFFPKALADIIDMADGDADALPRLEQRLEAGSAEARQVVGYLLRTAAGVQVSPRANLMDFGLSYAQKRDLHRRAVQLLGDAPTESVAAAARPGLETRLAERASLALRAIGKTAVLRSHLDSARSVLDQAVSPDSPLQAWRMVFQAIERPGESATPFLDADGRPLSRELQVAGWLALLKLGPSSGFLELLKPRFRTLADDSTGLTAFPRAAAGLHERIGDDEALAAAHRWVTAESDNPMALLCRFRALLRAGQPDKALSDATQAVRGAADRSLAVKSILESLAEGERQFARDPGRLKIVREMAESFRQIGT